jgi:hypothetical protein
VGCGPGILMRRLRVMGYSSYLGAGMVPSSGRTLLSVLATAKKPEAEYFRKKNA